MYAPVQGLETGDLIIEPSHARPGAPTALAVLLGCTRAAVLDALADPSGRTTKQLAQRLSISPTSASEHATALRTAGLVTSLRQANTVRHTTTPLGTTLLSTGRANGRSRLP
ncbi:winged helix-turn-helix domain-containing protein [Streptomyces sp. NPDC002870]|uniref:winged helix-turn-helix domain-containing protein n=1 Tax=Streptomyces sp. NPDC002870 TaxID=3364666 RepID=UPI0036A16B86